MRLLWVHLLFQLVVVGVTDGQLRTNMTVGGPEWNKVMDEVLMVLAPRWKRPKETYPTYAPTLPVGNDSSSAAGTLPAASVPPAPPAPPAAAAAAAAAQATVATAGSAGQRDSAPQRELSATPGAPPGLSNVHKHAGSSRQKQLQKVTPHMGQFMPQIAPPLANPQAAAAAPPQSSSQSDPLDPQSWQRRQRLLSQVIDETLALYGDNKVFPAPYANPNATRGHGLLASKISAYLPSLCTGLPEGHLSTNPQAAAAAAPKPTSSSSSSSPAQDAASSAASAASAFLFGKTARREMDTFRIGCCHSANEEYDERFLFNTKLEGKTWVLFAKHDPSPWVDAVLHSLPTPLPRSAFRGSRDELVLPPVQTDFFQQRHFFSMTAQRRDAALSEGHCRGFFEGTLHITGSSTLNNLYHVMVDNFLTLAAQILADAFYFPEYLHLPRMLLTGYEPPRQNPVPHVQLFDGLASAGSIDLKRADGMCFSRVVYNRGPRIFEVDTRTAMRRMTADFARLFVQRVHNITDEPLHPGYASKAPPPQRPRPASTGPSEGSVNAPAPPAPPAHQQQQQQQGKRRSLRALSASAAGGGGGEVGEDGGRQRPRPRPEHAPGHAGLSAAAAAHHGHPALGRHGARHHGINGTTAAVAVAVAVPGPAFSNGSSLCGGGGCLMPLPRAASAGNAPPYPLTVNEKDESLLVIDGRPLRVVVYSRGDSGNGRSLANEDLLVARLSALGAAVVKCCDYGKTSYQEQITLAFQADVVMGVHGAALAHAVFAPRGVLTLELKTLYGYGSTVFARISDARMGLHAQVNIKDYWKPGGHKPIDDAMVVRVVVLLRQGLAMLRTARVDNSAARLENVLVPGKVKGDFIAGPCATDNDDLRHVLGPVVTRQSEVCETLVLRKMKDEIGTKKTENCDPRDYCDSGKLSRRRWRWRF